MSAASDYLEKKLLDHLLMGNTLAYTGETTLYIGLFTADPGESGVANEFVLGVGGYARIAVDNNETNFPPCSGEVPAIKTNGTLLSFPKATTAWGTATHWAIYNASSAGDMLAHGTLAASYSIQIGQTPKIPIGALSFMISKGTSGGLTEYSKCKLLDLVFGRSSFPSPATIYLGLGTGLSGETLTEWGDASYARQPTLFTATTLGAGTCPNNGTETFVGTGATTGGTITHYGIWDSVAAGNLLAVGPLSSSKVVGAADTVDLASGAVIVTFQ